MSTETKLEIFRVEGHKRGVPFACRLRFPSGKSWVMTHPDGTPRMFPNEAMAKKAGDNTIIRLSKDKRHND